MYETSESVITVVLLAALFATEAAGRHQGSRHRESAGPDARSQVGALEAAVLGLLALLLGFTFSMAAERFDARRALTAQESNAISTTIIRTELTSEPEGAALKALLVRYVDARVRFYEAGYDHVKLAASRAECERMQNEMWALAVALVRRDSRPTTALLIESLNETIDLHDARVAAIYNHVPEVVIWFLVLVSVLAAGIAGYASGVTDARYWPSTVIVLLLVASVTIVIIDLDRPRRGLIRAGEPTMLDLQQSLRPH